MEAAEMDRLYRSRDDRMLAGVAGGLAELWDADPSLVRIVWALLVIFTGGLALVVYIVMAIVVPEEDDAWHPAASAGTWAAPAGTGGAPAGTATAPASTTAASPAAPAPAPAAPGASTTPAGSGWVSPPPTSRQLRAEARAARRSARAERGSSTTGGVVIGGFLILAGLFFLVRQYLPSIDFNWFWPVVLVALGAVLLLSAVGRGPSSGNRG
jgi:phage shock protein C